MRISKFAILLLICVIALSGCSSSDDMGNYERKDYIYSDYTGTWYGFGTSGQSAMFEAEITPVDENVFTFKEKGFGDNHNVEETSRVMTMISDSVADSDKFMLSEGWAKIRIEFVKGNSGKLYFVEYYMDYDTEDMCAQPGLYSRSPMLRDANDDAAFVDRIQNMFDMK